MGFPWKLREVHHQSSFCSISRIVVHKKAAPSNPFNNTTSHGDTSDLTMLGTCSIRADPLSCCGTAKEVPAVLWDVVPEAHKDKPFLDVSEGLTNLFCDWKLLQGAHFTLTHSPFTLLIAACNSSLFLASPISCFSFWNATGSSTCKESWDPNPTSYARASWWICISTSTLFGAIPYGWGWLPWRWLWLRWCQRRCLLL